MGLFKKVAKTVSKKVFKPAAKAAVKALLPKTVRSVKNPASLAAFFGLKIAPKKRSLKPRTGRKAKK